VPVPSQDSELSCMSVLVVSLPVPSQDSELSCMSVLVVSLPVPSQDSELSCMSVLVVSLLPLFSTVHRLDFGIVQTVWGFFCFFFIASGLILPNFK
jgi:fumarate reductase subunit D